MTTQTYTANSDLVPPIVKGAGLGAEPTLNRPATDKPAAGALRQQAFEICPKSRDDQELLAPTEQENLAAPRLGPTHHCDLEQAAPHAAALLCRVWDTPEVVRALRALMVNGDGHPRKWSLDVWAELALLRKLHQRMHPAPSPNAGALVDPAHFSAIELNYLRVVKRLQQCWGNVEAFAVVHHDLVIDQRGDRGGWPDDVWEDLVLLQKIHDSVFGELPSGAEPWKSFFLNA